jgi:hypothetical protein
MHPVCIGVPVPDADGYAKVWACESCHGRDGMPPHPSFGTGCRSVTQRRSTKEPSANHAQLTKPLTCTSGR